MHEGLYFHYLAQVEESQLYLRLRTHTFLIKIKRKEITAETIIRD